MTEKELNRIKSILVNEQEKLAENPVLLRDLMAINESKRNRNIFFLPPKIAFISTFIFLVFGVLSLLQKPKKEQIIVYKESETIHTYDTIFVKQTIPKKERIIGKSTDHKKRKIQVENTTDDLTNEGEFYFDPESVIHQTQNLGTASSESELAQFLGVHI